MKMFDKKIPRYFLFIYVHFGLGVSKLLERVIYLLIPSFYV